MHYNIKYYNTKTPPNKIKWCFFLRGQILSSRRDPSERLYQPNDRAIAQSSDIHSRPNVALQRCYFVSNTRAGEPFAAFLAAALPVLVPVLS